MKKTILIISIIFLSSFISATQIDIIPSDITLSGYPGESFLYNMTITTAEDFTVYLNSSNEDVKISPSEVYINYSTSFVLNITLDKDISPGLLNFEIYGYRWYPPELIQIININVGSGGGRGGGYRIDNPSGSCKETKWDCKNITNCTNNTQRQQCKSNCNKITYKNETCGVIILENNTIINNTNNTINNIGIKEVGPSWAYIISTFITILLIILIVFIIKRYNKCKNNDSSNINKILDDNISKKSKDNIINKINKH